MSNTTTSTSLPEPGWSVDREQRPVWVSHDKWASPPDRPGFVAWFVARHTDYVRFTYRPAGVR